MEETCPGRELAVAGHPLVPGQGTAIHVKRSYSEALMIRGVMIFKKWCDFEYPS